MFPRLTLDIGWRDLAFALATRGDEGAVRSIAAMAPAGRTAVTALSVRTALDAFLAELALPAGDEVLMSAVNIETMAEVVRAHGLVPVSVDIELATLAPSPETVEAAVTPRTRLFLLAHLYGARVETSGLAEVCRRRGLMFVEDLAQAYDGRLTASDGADASLYSFGPIKTATALGGAVALFADPDLARRVRARLDACPEPAAGWWRKRALKHAVLKALSLPPLYGLARLAIAAAGRDPEAVIGAAARGFRSGDLLPQLRRRPPKAMLALLARRLARGAAPLERTARARRVLWRLPPRIPVPGRDLASHAWWLAPVLPRHPDLFAQRLRDAGFDATRGATSLRALPGAPNAAHLIDMVVYLPLSPFLSQVDEARLADLTVAAFDDDARSSFITAPAEALST
ncbi:DegT/DnrJ/EryC1/StrS family aminotransferase [Caulobacter mirabilis]|uniref:Cell wall biogenesis protein n=1 Tax=Caulobacter mirabilis TaxID=69666 RepID=A0A2D2AW46_9CAUL|nr:DegT/DnrJ/EryC1/StrS family aminotransferase [Caulobacter mirabilis]ATQ42238.1 cell wall biogenesis protein [Caulobacter mirabilis]